MHRCTTIHRPYGIRRFATVLAVLGCLGSSLVLAQDRTLNIKPDAKVDAQLFLLRELEFLYSQWPTGFKDRPEVAKRLAKIRHKLVRGYEYAKIKRMDRLLQRMYSDSIEVADHYAELLVDLKVITNEYYRKQVEATTDSSVEGFTEGFGVGSAVAIAGIEPITGTVIIGGLMIKRAVQDHNRQQQLGEQKEGALLRRTTKYLLARATALGRLQAFADALGDKLGWDSREVGFDADEKESQRTLKAIESRDWDFLFEQAKTTRKVRPRDAFVFARSGELYAEFARDRRRWTLYESSAALETQASQFYVRAAELIPSGRFYDDLRAEYLLKAAKSESLKIYDSGKQSPYAITLANTALTFRPRDADARIRFTKAYALARNGYFSKAISLHDKVGAIQGRNASFHYDRACMLSLAAEPALALKALQEAWKKGIRNVRFIRQDKELSAVRNLKKKEFNDLINPQLMSSMDFGVFWNDVVIKNKGDYPLSLVAVKVTWTGEKGAEDVEVYWTRSIGGGKAHTFEGSFDRATEGKGKITSFVFASEETRSVERVSINSVLGGYSGDSTLMKWDGSDIRDSSKVDLSVEDAGKGKVRFVIKRSGVDVIDVICDQLVDGRVFVEPGVGGGPLIQGFFDRGKIYGWLQYPAERKEGVVHAFWLSKNP